MKLSTLTESQLAFGWDDRPERVAKPSLSTQVKASGFTRNYIVVDILRTDNVIERYTLYNRKMAKKYANMIAGINGDVRKVYSLSGSLKNDGASVDEIPLLQLTSRDAYINDLESANR